jgi:hypothetical protein
MMDLSSEASQSERNPILCKQGLRVFIPDFAIGWISHEKIVYPIDITLLITFITHD